jgi:hypothetical protein
MRQYLLSVLGGIVLGLAIGVLLGTTRADECKTRVSTQNLSVCADGVLAKAKEKFLAR